MEQKKSCKRLLGLHDIIPREVLSKGILFCYSWIDPETKEETMEYFPAKDEIFQKLQFMVILPSDD